jgi:hypothetical protein
MNQIRSGHGFLFLCSAHGFGVDEMLHAGMHLNDLALHDSARDRLLRANTLIIEEQLQLQLG